MLDDAQGPSNARFWANKGYPNAPRVTNVSFQPPNPMSDAVAAKVWLHRGMRAVLNGEC